MASSPMKGPMQGINTVWQSSSSSRRTLPIKRADAEPLTREDIQYDLLEALFNDRQAVFTNVSFGTSSSCLTKKITFGELYSSTLIASPRCSKVLREKMAETPEFAIDFAKISLLANIGRINTTMAFFPEMKTVLRSYHPIPSLQKSDANLQDAPRIKNCLKACLLPDEISNPPTTLEGILANAKSGVVPTTSIVNLIFVLSNHATPVSKKHFKHHQFDFLDLFLPVNASSLSRARAFLWLMFHYLESPSLPNPFADDFSRRHSGDVPTLVTLTSRQRQLENVDTESEIKYGKRMAQYRSKFLQKQIAEEEKVKERSIWGENGKLKAKFRITSPGASPRLPNTAREEAGKKKENFYKPLDYLRKNRTSTGISQVQGVSRGTQYRRFPPFQGEPSMLQYAWDKAMSCDPLLASDEEQADEHAKLEYERRLRILNSHVRQKELTPEPTEWRLGGLPRVYGQRTLGLGHMDWDNKMDI